MTVAAPASVGGWRRRLTDELAAAGVERPDVDAGLLLAHVLGLSRAQLVTCAATPVAPGAERTLVALAARRSAREPLQLLLGRAAFRRLVVAVRPGVFVPRPETEVLVDTVLERLPVGGIVVEPCTGSGAVAISVAAEACPDRVVATDRDPHAVALAAENATRAEVAVTVVRGDLLDPVDRGLRGRVDVLVSNPPYLAEPEWETVPPEVRHDPRAALVAGPTGFEVTDRLLDLARRWLAPGGWVALETDERRAARTAEQAVARGLVQPEVRRDLTGRDRVVLARRPAWR